jgi:hypothetical protein
MSSCASSYPTATPISIETLVSSAISVRTAVIRSSTAGLPAVEHRGLVGRAEPVGGLQRLVEDPLEPGYVRADDALRLLEPRRLGERLDGRLDLGVGVGAARRHSA